MRIFLCVACIFFAAITYAQPAEIRGRLVGKNGEALAGAFIYIGNTIYKTVTDSSGHFLLSGIPPGEYALVVEYVGYTSFTRHIRLKEHESEKLNIEMQPVGRLLQEVNIYGKLSQEEEAGAKQREKRANNIVNVISARAMERSPDINAANVLQRMSGLTIDRNGGGDEAYPVIRGLDPRYNNTLINGIKITSPDDKSRYVPLNIVPSDLLGSIEVHKSLLPEMEGDAIGGTVNMIMKDAPEKEVFKVLGWN